MMTLFRKKKILTVAISGIIGALLSTMLVLYCDRYADFGLSMILAIPTALIVSVVGTHYSIVCNGYVINGILFALIFSVIAAFLVKGKNEH